MTWLLPLLLTVTAAADPCAHGTAALQALSEQVSPEQVAEEARVIVGTLLAREGDDDAARWLDVPHEHPVAAIANLQLAQHHRDQGRLKSGVMAARQSMSTTSPDELSRDAALLLVSDTYFALGRYDDVPQYLELLQPSQLRSSAAGRRAVLLRAGGDPRAARRALRSVPDWRTDPDADMIWARHLLGESTRVEALAALQQRRAELQAIESVAQAAELGGVALLVTRAPDAAALECLAAAHPEDVELGRRHADVVRAEVDRLLARLDVAVEGVTTGALP